MISCRSRPLGSSDSTEIWYVLKRARHLVVPDLWAVAGPLFAFPNVGRAGAAEDDRPRPVSLSRVRLAGLAQTVREARTGAAGNSSRAHGFRAREARARQRRRRPDVTDQERQKAEELISRLELSVGQIFPRDGGNAALLTTMIQTLNGLRSVLGLVRPH
jgi:hypothetical protein